MAQTTLIPASRIVEVAAEIKEYQLRRGALRSRIDKTESELLKLKAEFSDIESKRLAAAREMDKLTE